MSAKLKEFLNSKFNGQAGSRLHGLTMLNATGDIDDTSLGYQRAITTLTFIIKEVTRQSFYQVAPADYVPIDIGNGAFSQALLTNVSLNTSGPFETGNINQGSGNDRLAAAGAGVSSKTTKIVNWAKIIGYSIFEIEQALRSNNWDFIEELHISRKENWDLGIQEIAFLGSASDADVTGLLTSGDVNINTSLITESISSMDATEFQALVAGLVQAYRANCNYTQYPTHFVIPESDYNGLASATSASFPIGTKIEYLEKMFRALCPGFQAIKPSVYAQAAFNTSRGVNKNRYALYNANPRSLRMNLPVDYTVTQPNSVNNFQFQDVGYGQYSGVQVLKNLELLYLDETAA